MIHSHASRSLNNWLSIPKGACLGIASTYTSGGSPIGTRLRVVSCHEGPQVHPVRCKLCSSILCLLCTQMLVLSDPSPVASVPANFHGLRTPAPSKLAHVFPMLPATSSAFLPCSSLRALISGPRAVSLPAPIT